MQEKFPADVSEGYRGGVVVEEEEGGGEVFSSLVIANLSVLMILMRATRYAEV